MTRSQKVMLIVLAMLLLLFVALVVWGQTRPAFSASDKANYRPGAAMKAIGGLFSSGRKGVELPQKQYRLGAGQRHSIPIAGWDGDMRTLKLRRLQGQMQVSVVLNRPPNKELLKQSDPAPLPYNKSEDRPDDPLRTAYAVNSDGGRLVIDCEAAAPCVLETE